MTLVAVVVLFILFFAAAQMGAFPGLDDRSLEGAERTRGTLEQEADGGE